MVYSAVLIANLLTFLQQKDWDLINKFRPEHVSEQGEVEEVDPDAVSAICHCCLVSSQPTVAVQQRVLSLWLSH